MSNEVEGLESWLRVQGLMSKFQVNLIKAEEDFLRFFHWKLVSRHESQSVWEHPRYELKYSRNHAVQIAKVEDLNLGYW
jgi:hypothetical protein